MANYSNAVLIAMMLLVATVIVAELNGISGNAVRSADPVASGYGNLSVTSEPSDAKVYLDGEYKGVTPVFISYIASGNHTLQVTKAGYQSQKEIITIYPGDTTFIHAILQELNQTGNRTGNLYVVTSPADAWLYVDGEYKGLTPITVNSLSEGNHAAKIRKQGCYGYQTTVYVVAGSTTTLNVYLNPNNQTNTTNQSLAGGGGTEKPDLDECKTGTACDLDSQCGSCSCIHDPTTIGVCGSPVTDTLGRTTNDANENTEPGDVTINWVCMSQCQIDNTDCISDCPVPRTFSCVDHCRAVLHSCQSECRSNSQQRLGENPEVLVSCVSSSTDSCSGTCTFQSNGNLALCYCSGTGSCDVSY